jgi:hypothetical protein
MSIREGGNLTNFGKIPALGSEGTQKIFEGDYEITEKIDGSQVCFVKNKLGLQIISKHTDLIKGTQKMFMEAVDYLHSIEGKIPENIIFYCEYLQKPRHNVLKYSRIPKNHLACFSMSKITPTKVIKLRQVDRSIWCGMLDIEPVRILQMKLNGGKENLEEYLDQESALGGCKIEGIVIKNYTHHIKAKYVSPAFKEIAKVKTKTPKSDNWADYKKSYVATARYDKAYIHLKEQGIITGQTSDICAIIKETQRDIIEEHKQEITEFLWRKFSKELLAGAIKDIPNWYRDKLATGDL